MKLEVKISHKKVEYNKAIQLLEKRVDDVIKGKKPELLWILEHNSIYTGGTSYKNEEILNKKIKIIKTSRGGKITYHGPGQKVVYFVLNLNKRKKNIRFLITKVENCIIQILNNYNIKSFPDRNKIGIWVNHKTDIKKIAAIGIRVRKWVAYHGFSINISNNLKFYKNIIPCGIIDRGITNLESINNKNYKNINKIIIKTFNYFFN
jgi:lipoyl(octanoyl) transferase